MCRRAATYRMWTTRNGARSGLPEHRDRPIDSEAPPLLPVGILRTVRPGREPEPRPRCGSGQVAGTDEGTVGVDPSPVSRRSESSSRASGERETRDPPRDTVPTRRRRFGRLALTRSRVTGWRMPSRILPALAGALAAALVATGVVAVVQTRSADEAVEQLDERADALADALDERDAARAERDAAQDERDALREERDALLDERRSRTPAGATDSSTELLDGLLGELLGELLGDAAPLGASTAAGTACAVSEAGRDGSGGLAELLRPSEAVDDLDELVARTSDEVADLRTLDWARPAGIAFLDDAGTRARLAEVTLPDDDTRDELEAQQHLLRALGALPDGENLVTIRETLLAEAVAGFYVSETEEVVVRVPDDGGPGPADRITLAHELQHALADQVLGLPDLEAIDDIDAARAALALVEGDATLLMSLWSLRHLALTEQLGLALNPALGGQQAVLETFPDVVVRELLFPYTAGLAWVCDVYLDGGWAAVDDAYADPPETTWEILFGAPATVGVAPALLPPSGGHRELARVSFGAADLLWQLEAPGGDPRRAIDQAVDRARAWGGGRAVIWQGPGPSGHTEVSVGLALHDSGAGVTDLCATILSWAGEAFGAAAGDVDGSTAAVFPGRRSAAVRCEDGHVIVGLADDLRTATSVAAG